MVENGCQKVFSNDKKLRKILLDFHIVVRKKSLHSLMVRLI